MYFQTFVDSVAFPLLDVVDMKEREPEYSAAEMLDDGIFFYVSLFIESHGQDQSFSVQAV